MNESSTDSELQQILKEARENYSKRIQFLKNSMQGIVKELPSDRSSVTERCDYSQAIRPQRIGNENELVQSLSKIQVLEIENKNLKSIIQKEDYRTPPRYPHKRNFSGNSENSSDFNRLKEILELCEKENKELRSLTETLKETSKELEQRESETKSKLFKVTDELNLSTKQNQDLEDTCLKFKSELEKLKKEKLQISCKVKDIEIRNQAICNELEAVQMEKNRLKIRETQNTNFIKSKEKSKIYKEKFQEVSSKLSKAEQILSDKDSKIHALNSELKEKSRQLEEKTFFINELESMTTSLKSDLAQSQSSLKSSEELLSQVRSSHEIELSTLTRSQSSLVASYESKLQALQQESSEKVSKTASDILTQLDQIEIDYKAQLEKQVSKYTNLAKVHSELQSSYKILSDKYLILEEEFMKKQEEFEIIYRKEVNQHKNDVLALESEVQKLYETKSQTSTDVEVIVEKYKVLKTEYFQAQQEMHLNKVNYEKELHDVRNKLQDLENMAQTTRSREGEGQKEIEKYQKKVTELANEINKNKEEKTKLSAELDRNKMILATERNKIKKIKELVKISLKQMKNEFFQSAKTLHRAVFEELLMCKRCISECSSLLLGQLSAVLQSWSAQVNSTLANKKQLQDFYMRESDNINEVRLQVSQLERELRIKDDRIFYLESSFKSSLSRGQNGQELIANLLNQVTNLEELYSNNYREQVDMMIYLKSLINKEQMEVSKDLQVQLSNKEYLLKQARLEILKSQTMH